MGTDSIRPRRYGIFGGYGQTANLAPSKIVVVLNANHTLTTGVEAIIGSSSLWTVQENTGGWSVNADGSLAAPSGLTHISAVGHLTFAHDAGQTEGREIEIRLAGAWNGAEASRPTVRWIADWNLDTTGTVSQHLYAPIVRIPDPYPAVGVHLRALQTSGGNLNVVPSGGAAYGDAGTWLNVTGYFFPEMP